MYTYIYNFYKFVKLLKSFHHIYQVLFCFFVKYLSYFFYVFAFRGKNCKRELDIHTSIYRSYRIVSDANTRLSFYNIYLYYIYSLLIAILQA